MKIIVIDGRQCPDKAAAHEYLSGILVFPGYCGKNLDALYDFLTSITDEVGIQIENPSEIINSLGAYGTKLLRVFEDAAGVNSHIKVEMI